jgi:hypothetical protein
MLGDKLGRSTGKITGRRVLRTPEGGMKMETSFEGSGKLLGVECGEHATYHSMMRPDGTLFGEGQGLVMGKSGARARWTGQGVGTVRPDGSAMYRGALYYESAHPKWARLNTVAVVFEFSVDAKGRTKADIWEWK